MTTTEQMNTNSVPLDKRVAGLCGGFSAICISTFFSIMGYWWDHSSWRTLIVSATTFILSYSAVYMAWRFHMSRVQLEQIKNGQSGWIDTFRPSHWINYFKPVPSLWISLVCIGVTFAFAPLIRWCLLQLVGCG